MGFGIQIYEPNVVVTLSDSNQGIVPGPNSGLRFGTVYQIPAFSDRTQVGLSVLFPETKALLVTDGTASYFLINGNDLIFQENPVT